jgi:hypothetical protein
VRTLPILAVYRGFWIGGCWRSCRDGEVVRRNVLVSQCGRKIVRYQALLDGLPKPRQARDLSLHSCPLPTRIFYVYRGGVRSNHFNNEPKMDLCEVWNVVPSRLSCTMINIILSYLMPAETNLAILPNYLSILTVTVWDFELI